MGCLDEDESFIRWQGYTLNHFTAVISIILSLSTGTLAFQVNLLLSSKLQIEDAALQWIQYSLILMLLSIAFAIFCLITRLTDFRMTAQIARLRKTSDVGKLRCWTKYLGRVSWVLFGSSAILFTAGILLMVIFTLEQLK